MGALADLGIPPRVAYEEAFTAFVRNASPVLYPEHIGFAEAALGVGDYETALEQADWCLLHRPDDPEAHRLRCRAALGGLAVQQGGVPVVGAGSESTPTRLAASLDASMQRLQQLAPADPGLARIVAACDEIAQDAPVRGA